MEFKLDEEFAGIIAVGVIQWKKRKGISHYQYGIKFIKDDGLNNKITDDLKKKK